MDKIDRKKFPELDQLLWDTKQRYFEAKDALEIYERRWSFVDQSKLTENERQLINTCAKQAGGFLPVLA